MVSVIQVLKWLEDRMGLPVVWPFPTSPGTPGFSSRMRNCRWTLQVAANPCRSEGNGVGITCVFTRRFTGTSKFKKLQPTPQDPGKGCSQTT